MTVTTLGNHSKGFLSESANGNGIQNVPVGMGWIAATASEAGDEVVIQLTSLLAGQLQQGIYFQAEAAATVAYTLFNPGLAASPDPLDQASVVWTADVAIAPGITKAPVLFTCMRITFGAPGTVYVGAR